MVCSARAAKIRSGNLMRRELKVGIAANIPNPLALNLMRRELKDHSTPSYHVLEICKNLMRRELKVKDEVGCGVGYPLLGIS